MLAPHALQPGSRLGRYVLERFLGEGGFAEVWLARRGDAPAGEPVAIKLVRRGRFQSALHRTMFLDEANIAARIRHPNVASVFEIGDDEGMPFLVMEYVAGGSLEAVVRGARALNEPVPVGMAVRIAEDLCSALHAAHELAIDGRPQHVVHRDVSPQNVLMTSDGVPKLIDFGIAKARERLSKETSTGIAKGKISYMSPEQARGEELDRRADLWSVAALLYEVLEGERLLDRGNDMARLQALVSRPVRPAFNRTPPGVAAVLRRALSFHADDRQESAEELRAELAQARSAEGLGASPGEVAEFCRRAREAAELAGRAEGGVSSLRALLPAATADVTVSTVKPSPRSAWIRRLGVTMLVALVGLVGIGVAMRGGFGASSRLRAGPPETASSPPPAASPVSSQQVEEKNPAREPRAAASTPAPTESPPLPAAPTARSQPTPTARRSPARSPATAGTKPPSAKPRATATDDDRID